MCKNVFRRHRNHCIHCDGRKGPCSCTSGCPPEQHNLCLPFHEHVLPFHEHVPCSYFGMKGMSGNPFKCRHCYDYNLCSGCFIGGAHDSNHAFMKIEHAGVPPTFVSPRSGAPTSQDIMESARMLTPASPQPISAQQPALNSNTPQTLISKVSSTIGVSSRFNHA